MDDLISIVNPAYNALKFIGSAIQSIFNRTNRKIEVIVVDGYSKDDTSKQLFPYRDKIQVVRNEKN